MTERFRTYMQFSSDDPDAPALRRMRKDAMRSNKTSQTPNLKTSRAGQTRKSSAKRVKRTQATKRKTSSSEHSEKTPKLTHADSPHTNVNPSGSQPYASEFDRLAAIGSIETTLPAKSQSSPTVVVDKSPTVDSSALYDELYGSGEEDVDYEELTSSSEDNLDRSRGVTARASPMHSRELASVNTLDATQLVTDRKVLQTTSVEKYTLKGLSSSALLKMRENRRKLRSAGLNDSLFADISEEIHDTLKLIFGVYLEIIDISTHDLEVWIDSNEHEFFTHLIAIAAESLEKAMPEIVSEICAVPLTLRWGNKSSVLDYLSALTAKAGTRGYSSVYSMIAEEQNKTIFDTLKKTLITQQKGLSNVTITNLQSAIFSNVPQAEKSLKLIVQRLFNEWNKLHAHYSKCIEIGLITPNMFRESAVDVTSKRYTKDKQPLAKQSFSTKPSTSHPQKQPVGSNRCKRCNNKPSLQNPNERCIIDGSSKPTCAMFSHPDCNRTKSPWRESAQGIAYAALKPPVYFLSKTKKLNKNQTELIDMVCLSLNTTTTVTNANSYPQPTVICQGIDGKSFTALIDPGSTGTNLANYISSSTAQQLEPYGSCKCSVATTCTPTGCFKSKNCIKLRLVLLSKEARLENTDLEFRIVHGLNKGLGYDSIIGYESIKRLDLTGHFRHLFIQSSHDHSAVVASMCQECSSTTTPTLGRQLSQIPFKLIKMIGDRKVPTRKCKHAPRRVFFPNGDTLSAAKRDDSSPAVLRQITSKSLFETYPSNHDATTAYLNALTEQICIDKESLLDIEEDDDQIDDYVNPSIYEEWINEDRAPNTPSKADIDSDILDKIKIMYPDEYDKERQHIIEIILQMKSIFAKELSNAPAKIDPFELTLNNANEWHSSNRNKQSSRLQSVAKQIAVKKFITKAIANGVIRPSQADAWSQILLTPKPDGSWRFCIDFRTLNNVTKSMGWPIPNIAQVLQRIGEKKAKWFAVLDLTSGYNQAPVGKRSIPLTAFICSEGLFEWTRLPMGLKGAGSYFQHHMSNTILRELVQQILEVYLDDIIVYANSPKELNQRLEQVFKRLQSFGITLNPDKVRIGMQEVEYVGHLIDEDGLSFSEEKKLHVLNFRRPETASQMKSFLGLTSQFREHVKDYGVLAAPLHNMIPNYKKHSKVQLLWTEELTESFKTLQRSVSGCQKLFFIDDTSPIFLHTDASNYGIGAYLFQEVNNVRHPISFISRQLNKTELKWSTIEKEAYSIFHAFMKLEHLIRDRHFTLKTDSKNLTFLNVDHREKVKRWKLAIQHFDFNIFHIPGKDNIEADAFSRLVPFPEKAQATLSAMRQAKVPDPEEPELKPHMYNKIKSVHGGVHGHGGVQRTLNLFKKQGTYFKHMRKYVEMFIQRCPCCQKMSALKPVIHIKPFTLATYNPMERICIDTIGPINEEGQDEYKYIVVIIDAFSRFCRLYATKDTTAESALDSLKDWICTFGCPSTIVSDNGTQFANQLIRAFLENSNVQHSLIHAYSKEENSLVERANKEVSRHVTSMAYDSVIRAVWRNNLPYIQRIMNTSIHSSIGVSPSQLIFGGCINHDAHFLNEPTQNDNQVTYHDAIKNLYDQQERLLHIARTNQHELDSFHIAQRTPGEISSFPINSYVLAEYETSKPSKFSTNKHGPYRVISNIGPIYTLENLITHKLSDFHIKLLTEFKYDSNIDPEEVAKHDNEYDDIQQILAHRFNSKRKSRSDIEFHILWARNQLPVWTQWNATIASNQTIHDYLNENKLRRLIPTKYTWPKDHPEYVPPRQSQKVTKDDSPNQSTKKKRRKRKSSYKLLI